MSRSASPASPPERAVTVALRSGRKQTAERSKARNSTVNATQPTLSQTLWGKDFLEDLPYTLSNAHNIQVVRGDWDRAAEFLSWFPELQEESSRQAIRPEVQEAKQRYLRVLSDLMECRKDGQTIGIFIGAPEDWSTYYCRVLAMHPQYNVRPMLRRFARHCLEKPLSKLGVERLVGETSPANTAMARWFLELGFHITGQRLTDRWGPMTRFTKFLDQSCSKKFAHRCNGGRGERKHRGHSRKGGNP